MPIKTACPECDRTYNLADTMAGKTVKCKDCGKSFAVEDIPEVVPAEPKNGQAKTSVSNGKPAAKPVAKKRRDDDDDDRPPKKKKSDMGKWLMIGGGVAALLVLLVCGGGGLLAYKLLNPSATPDTPPVAQNTTPTTQPLATNPNPATNPLVNNPLSKVTKPNFDKIKGGMTEFQLQDTLDPPTNWNATLDPAASNFKSAKTQQWQNGTDSINVTYCAGKAARWVGVFNGQTYTMQDPTYILDKNATPPTPTPGTTTLITKENFDKIKAGSTMQDMTTILGKPTKPNAPVDPSATASVGPRGKAQRWENGADYIMVNYFNNQVSVWSAMINGQNYTGSDPNNVYNKPTTKPNTTTQVTKANYNQIGVGTAFPVVVQTLGSPTNVQAMPNIGMTKTNPGQVQFKAIWTDGQGGEMTLHFVNNVLRSKSERGLK